MSEGKKTFLLKKEQREVFESLNDEDAGKLIKGIYEYVDTGESNLKGTLKAVFIPIKKAIDKNEEQYQKVVERNKKNGSLGGRPKKEKNPKNPVGYSGLKKEVKKTQSVFLGKKPHISYTTNHISYNHNTINDIKYIINYLNNKINSKYKYTTKSTQEKIKARLNEGFKTDDFIVVIDKKYEDWYGTEFEKYLRPETLFGTKFEAYLNQKSKNNLPEWFDKNIKEEKTGEEEKNNLKEILEKYE